MMSDDVWCKFGLTILSIKYDRIQLHTTIESLVLEFEDFLAHLLSTLWNRSSLENLNI